MVYGHPSILSIPIPKILVIWASPSHIILAIWVKVRVGVIGDANTSLPVGLGMGMPNPYHCDRGKKKGDWEEREEAQFSHEDHGG